MNFSILIMYLKILFFKKLNIFFWINNNEIRTQTKVHTITSVGQCTPLATLEKDIKKLNIQKTIDNLIKNLFLYFIHQSNVDIAIAADTAAWSEGNGLVGRCCNIRLSWFVIICSGLDLSTKYCTNRLKATLQDALKKT